MKASHALTAAALFSLVLGGCGWGYVPHQTNTEAANPIQTIEALDASNHYSIQEITSEHIVFRSMTWGGVAAQRQLNFWEMTALEIRIKGPRVVVHVYGSANRRLIRLRVHHVDEARALADALATLHARLPR